MYLHVCIASGNSVTCTSVLLWNAFVVLDCIAKYKSSFHSPVNLIESKFLANNFWSVGSHIFGERSVLCILLLLEW